MGHVMSTPEVSTKRGRGRPQIFDREVALEKALVLFWERGFEATSMSELIEAMGMSPSSIYATWSDKEGLFRAVLDRYVSGPGGYAAPLLREAATARDGFEALFEKAASHMTTEGQPKGCLVGLSGTQVSSSATSVQAALTAVRRESRDAMEERLRAGQEVGELPPKVDVSDLASFFASVLQGMSISARDGASEAELRAVGRRAMAAWPK